MYTHQNKISFSTCSQEAAKLFPFCPHTQLSNLVPAPAIKQNRRIKATCPIHSHLCWGPGDYQMNWFIFQMLEVWAWCQQAVQHQMYQKVPAPAQIGVHSVSRADCKRSCGKVLVGRGQDGWHIWNLMKLYCRYKLPVTRNGDDIGNHWMLSLNSQSSKHFFCLIIVINE